MNPVRGGDDLHVRVLESYTGIVGKSLREGVLMAHLHSGRIKEE